MTANDFNPLPPRFPRWPLWTSLGIFLLLTAALMAAVPLGKSPDEASHWQYVEHISLTGQLPVFRGAPPPQPGNEFHQPPLYYLLCTPGWNWAGVGLQNYVCRAISLGCGLATIVLIWNAARLLFPLNSRVASLAALLAALWPLHQGVSAGGNNDSLAGLLSAALFFLMARLGVSGATWRDVWQLGIVAGLAILTKNTLLVVVATAFLALLFGALRDDSRIRPIPALGTAFGLSLLVSGAWLVRNNTLYGDPFAYGIFTRAANAVAIGFPEAPRLGISDFSYVRGMIWQIFVTAWGFFGGPNASLNATRPFAASGPHLDQPWLWAPMVVCLLAPLAAARGLWRRNSRILLPALVSRFWALGTGLIFLAWLQFAYHFFAGGQARYLHPALLPLCVLGAAGWIQFWGEGRALRWASLLLGAVLFSSTLLNIFEWKTLSG